MEAYWGHFPPSECQLYRLQLELLKSRQVEIKKKWTHTHPEDIKNANLLITTLEF